MIIICIQYPDTSVQHPRNGNGSGLPSSLQSWVVCTFPSPWFRVPDTQLEAFPPGSIMGTSSCSFCLITLGSSCQESNSKEGNHSASTDNQPWSSRVERVTVTHWGWEECLMFLWSTWVSLHPPLLILLTDEDTQQLWAEKSMMIMRWDPWELRFWVILTS